jgi:hypothetical protein
MVLFIAPEKDRSVSSFAEMLEANDVMVKRFRAIQVADVQLDIAQLSIADHGNAPP